MPIQIFQAKEKQDPLEKLANALNIAKAIYGITADSKTLDVARQKQAELSKANEQEMRLKNEASSGVLNAKDLLQYGATDISDTPKPGYIQALIKQPGNETPLQKFIKPKTGESSLEAISKGLSVKEKQIDIQKKEKELSEGKLPTGDQSKAALFAKRMEQAEGIFSDLSNSGESGTDLGSATQRAGINIPIIGRVGYPEIAKSDISKKRDQAERNFVNAVLRRESGAAIVADEFESAEKQYFPRIGDSPELLEQKRQNRQLAINALSAEAGDRAMSRIKDPSKKDSKIEEYASSNNLTYPQAEKILRDRGYGK